MCADLQVTTEDTVLFTAQQYVSAQQVTEQQQAASEQLALLVRCPYLSPCWLTAGARARQSELLLALLKEHLLNLLACVQLAQNSELSAERMRRAILPTAPRSWLQGPRQLKAEVESVQVTWRLSISQIRQVCQEAAATHTMVQVHSPEQTPPIRGTAYQLVCSAKPVGSGVTLGIHVCVSTLTQQPDMYVRFSGFLVTRCVRLAFRHSFSAHKTQHVTRSRGWHDFFALGPMANGFDEAAWAARGMPATVISLSRPPSHELVLFFGRHCFFLQSPYIGICVAVLHTFLCMLVGADMLRVLMVRCGRWPSIGMLCRWCADVFVIMADLGHGGWLHINCVA